MELRSGSLVQRKARTDVEKGRDAAHGSAKHHFLAVAAARHEATHEHVEKRMAHAKLRLKVDRECFRVLLLHREQERSGLSPSSRPDFKVLLHQLRDDLREVSKGDREVHHWTRIGAPERKVRCVQAWQQLRLASSVVFTAEEQAMFMDEEALAVYDVRSASTRMPLKQRMKRKQTSCQERGHARGVLRTRQSSKPRAAVAGPAKRAGSSKPRERAAKRTATGAVGSLATSATTGARSADSRERGQIVHAEAGTAHRRVHTAERAASKAVVAQRQAQGPPRAHEYVDLVQQRRGGPLQARRSRSRPGMRLQTAERARVPPRALDRPGTVMASARQSSRPRAPAAGNARRAASSTQLERGAKRITLPTHTCETRMLCSFTRRTGQPASVFAHVAEGCSVFYDPSDDMSKWLYVTYRGSLGYVPANHTGAPGEVALAGRN